MNMEFHSVGRVGTPLVVIVEWDTMPLPEPRSQRMHTQPMLMAEAARRGMHLVQVQPDGAVDILDAEDDPSDETQESHGHQRREGSFAKISIGNAGAVDCEHMHPAMALNSQPHIAWDRRKARRMQEVLSEEQLRAVVSEHHPLPSGLYLMPAGAPRHAGDDTPCSYGPVAATDAVQQRQHAHSLRNHNRTLTVGEVLSSLQSHEVSGPAAGDPEFKYMATDDVAPLGESAEFWAQAKRRRLVQDNLAAAIHKRAAAHKASLLEAAARGQQDAITALQETALSFPSTQAILGAAAGPDGSINSRLLAAVGGLSAVVPSVHSWSDQLGAVATAAAAAAASAGESQNQNSAFQGEQSDVQLGMARWGTSGGGSKWGSGGPSRRNSADEKRDSNDATGTNTPEEAAVLPAAEWVSLTRAQQLDLPLFGGVRSEDPLYSMAPQEAPGVRRPSYVVGPHRFVAPPEMFMFGRRPGAEGGGVTALPPPPDVSPPQLAGNVPVPVALMQGAAHSGAAVSAQVQQTYQAMQAAPPRMN